MTGMKKALLTAAFLLTLTACPGEDKGGDAPVATAPETSTGTCQYDYYSGSYQYEDGAYCTYDDWHDPKACYNFYYNYQFGRYYNEAGDPVDCNQQYTNGTNVFPYPYYYSGGWQAYNTCPWGTYPTTVGGNVTVCVSNNVSPGADLNWWWWIHFQ